MMQVYHGIPAQALSAEATLTIGVFDGVHRGHQLLIGRAVECARESQRLCGVLTFDPHPVEVLAPDARIRYLSDIAERARLIAQLGADFLCVIPFTRETAQTSAREFVRPLVERLHMRELLIGYDFTLGHKRQGDANFLRALGAEWGFTLEVVGPLAVDGAIVSSTRIRKMLNEGEVEQAAQLLGHLPAVKGVLRDDCTLAFDPRMQLPADGWYSAMAHADTSDALLCLAHVRAQQIQLHDSAHLRALVGQAVRAEFRARDGHYEEIAHTADVAIRVRAHSLEGLLTSAARGMFALMSDSANATFEVERAITASGSDRESLLVNWLNELLFQAEVQQETYHAFEVTLDGHHAQGIARGGPSGEIRKQIKAVTFHDLRIEERDGTLEATIVFDV